LGFYAVGRKLEPCRDGFAIDFHLTCVAILNFGGVAVVDFEVLDDGRWVFNLPN
jgi:hypothetical protein